ncbi:MAG TPA: hypothetical protein VHV56_13295 [Pseudolabrys sp.]|nr:hypothetical protein [Pseudolabrys sp.]
MNRVGDYIGFVVWFIGLGYVVLWLVAKFDQPILPPALHAVGVLAACFVALRLLMLAHLRRCASAASAAVAAQVVRTPATPPDPSRAVRALPPVKPRSHFGLRGTPH